MIHSHGGKSSPTIQTFQKNSQRGNFFMKQLKLSKPHIKQQLSSQLREREQLWCALHCSCRSLSDEVGQSLKILSLKICPPIFSKLQLLICSFDKFASEEFFAYFYKLSWHFVSSFFKESALHCLSLLKVWLCSFSEKNISAKLLVKCG